jgi:cell division protein ZipA
MEELRWILIIVGIGIVAGVYLWGRRNDTGATLMEYIRSHIPAGDKRPRPARRDMDRFDGSADELEQLRDMIADEKQEPVLLNSEAFDAEGNRPRPREDEQMVVAVHVAARGEERFSGVRIMGLLDEENLTYDTRMHIYHRGSPERPEFSVASMVEPGRLNRMEAEEFSTPGLSLFMVLPGPDDPLKTFDDLMATAGRLADRLDGQIQDERHSTMSQQTLDHIRERIVDHRRRMQLNILRS